MKLEEGFWDELGINFGMELERYLEVTDKKDLNRNLELTLKKRNRDWDSTQLVTSMILFPVPNRFTPIKITVFLGCPLIIFNSREEAVFHGTRRYTESTSLDRNAIPTWRTPRGVQR